MDAWVNPDAMPPGEFLMKFSRDLTELAKAGKIVSIMHVPACGVYARAGVHAYVVAARQVPHDVFT